MTKDKPYELFADCRKSKGCPLSWVSIVYGPFKSRRRGLSLGINLFPVKSVCSFNCIYCFRGGAQIKACRPTSGPYKISASEVKNALEIALDNVDRINAIDFSGNGEPTLHESFSKIVKGVYRFLQDYGVDASLGLFTNSTMLSRQEVLKAVEDLDHIEAKLDVIPEWKFKIINRPCRNLSVKKIVENLITLRKSFSGTLAIQTILLEYKGLKNFTERDARLLAKELNKVKPDVVNIYTVYRKPRLELVKPASREAMNLFSEILKEEGFEVKVFYE